jgi:hypothetical protein
VCVANTESDRDTKCYADRDTQCNAQCYTIGHAFGYTNSDYQTASDTTAASDSASSSLTL